MKFDFTLEQYELVMDVILSTFQAEVDSFSKTQKVSPKQVERIQELAHLYDALNEAKTKDDI